ncbi:MAG TPA: spermidine/putrescine ABC transporter substrate-binding protein [Bryobacteraceae bacterium]|nr:spermidine/putrescine ABC transporter substrate-binding protein [Bryobacteraceae bacterium]
MNRLLKRRVFLMGVAGAAGCAHGRPRLNVYNWSNYVAPDTVANFERECGVRVRYATYESNEEMLAKVLGGNSGWDVVFPTHNRIAPMRQYGLLAPLDHARLTNLPNLEARFQTPPWDPHLEHCVPYMWGATGIAYNGSVTPAPAAWADLWEARLKGRLTMLDDPEEVLGACLLKLRLSYNSTGGGHLRRAEQEAIAQKPLLRAYLNAEYRDQMVAGDILVAHSWATTAQQAIDAAPQLAFAYPAEGFPLYCDNAVLLRESRRAELAHAFINYLLRAPVAAAIVETSRTATANAAAQALLPDALRRNTTLFPSSETLARGQWIGTMPAATQRLRDRIWTEIKSA